MLPSRAGKSLAFLYSKTPRFCTANNWSKFSLQISEPCTWWPKLFKIWKIGKKLDGLEISVVKPEEKLNLGPFELEFKRAKDASECIFASLDTNNYLKDLSKTSVYHLGCGYHLSIKCQDKDLLGKILKTQNLSKESLAETKIYCTISPIVYPVYSVENNKRANACNHSSFIDVLFLYPNKAFDIAKLLH